MHRHEHALGQTRTGANMLAQACTCVAHRHARRITRCTLARTIHSLHIPMHTLRTAIHTFLADHDIVFVFAVVGIPQAAIWAELELHKLVTELAAMSNTVAQGRQYKGVAAIMQTTY